MPTRSKTASRAEAGETAAGCRPGGSSFSMPPKLPACIALKGTQADMRVEEAGRRGRGLPAPAQLSLSLSPLARLAPSPGSQVQQSCEAAQMRSPAGIKSPPTRLAPSPGSQVSRSSLTGLMMPIHGANSYAYSALVAQTSSGCSDAEDARVRGNKRKLEVVIAAIPIRSRAVQGLVHTVRDHKHRTNCRDQRRWIWGRLPQKTADQEHFKSVKRASSAWIVSMRVGAVCFPRLLFTRPLPPPDRERGLCKYACPADSIPSRCMPVWTYLC